MTAVFDTLWREAADPSHIRHVMYMFPLKLSYYWRQITAMKVFTQILFGELLGASSAQFAKKKKPIQP